jgi:hypothetical protein
MCFPLLRPAVFRCQHTARCGVPKGLARTARESRGPLRGAFLFPFRLRRVPGVTHPERPATAGSPFQP